MRYITNAEGYLVTVSFGADIECVHGVCTEYTGSVPTGYTSLEAWYAEESEKLHRWKVVDGQLTLDEGAATPRQCNSLVDMVYPVGSIYLAYNHANPADLFGGTWERIENAFLWAVDAEGRIGLTGGEKEHTLTVEELPSHGHSACSIGISSAGYSASGYVAMRGTEEGNKGTTSTTYVSNTGGGQAHNNMPPFIQISAWRRTA